MSLSIIISGANQDQWITANILNDFFRQKSCNNMFASFQEFWFIDFRRDTNNIG